MITPERWLDSDPGDPLGTDYPCGPPLRLDSETHRGAWMRLVRADPCAYCEAPGAAGTLDHIEPRSRRARSPGGAHHWTNYTGACPRCNSAKADRPLLLFLAGRRGATVPAGCSPPRRRSYARRGEAMLERSVAWSW